MIYYVKTERGKDEIRLRKGSIDRGTRTVLLCVDGTRGLDDLQKLVAASHAPSRAIEILIDLELIAPADNADIPSSTLAAPSVGPLPVEETDLDLRPSGQIASVRSDLQPSVLPRSPVSPQKKQIAQQGADLPAPARSQVSVPKAVPQKPLTDEVPDSRIDPVLPPEMQARHRTRPERKFATAKRLSETRFDDEAGPTRFDADFMDSTVIPSPPARTPSTLSRFAARLLEKSVQVFSPTRGGSRLGSATVASAGTRQASVHAPSRQVTRQGRKTEVLELEDDDEAQLRRIQEIEKKMRARASAADMTQRAIVKGHPFNTLYAHMDLALQEQFEKRPFLQITRWRMQMAQADSVQSLEVIAQALGRWLAESTDAAQQHRYASGLRDSLRPPSPT